MRDAEENYFKVMDEFRLGDNHVDVDREGEIDDSPE
jgi:hypothetical protein